MKYIATEKPRQHTNVGQIIIEYTTTKDTFDVYSVTDEEAVVLKLAGTEDMLFDSIAVMLEHANAATGPECKIQHNIDITLC